VPTLGAFRAAVGEARYAAYDVLAVDEAQFFPDLLDFAAAAADADGKRVVLAGLDGDFQRRRFGQVGWRSAGGRPERGQAELPGGAVRGTHGKIRVADLPL
jgi:hypothetical protein